MIATRSLCRKKLGAIKSLVLRTYANAQNPFKRTWNILSNDMRVNKSIVYPEHADIVIIGGGYIGSSIAYWLKNRAGPGLSVVVLQKEFTNNEDQNNGLLGTLSQHYSLPENIYLSQFSAEFFRNIKEHLNSDVNIEYYPYGQLVLASEKYAEQLEKNVEIQREHGTRNKILTTAEINKKYPWINTSDIKLGCLSTEGDGVFNARKFYTALVTKSIELGAMYVNAEAIGFDFEEQKDILMEGLEPGEFKKIRSVTYKTSDSEIHQLNFAACIVAAGVQSTNIARMAKIGVDKGLLTIPLPIDKRIFNSYSIDNSSKTLPVGINVPFIMDTSGLWLRRNHLENNLLCGHIPLLEVDNQCIDEFNDLIYPTLMNRFPECKNMKISKLGSEVYDYNTYDDTGILGPHAYHGTLIFATGFGQQGCQHAPGIGRAVAELLIDGHFTTIDLTRFGFDRILTDYPLIESNIY